jgi:hypothetical protein
MAKASRHHVGQGAKGKGSGTGALTELPEGVLEENMVLSNRDKSRHSDGRGLDSRMVQTEQFHDHAGNRRILNAGFNGAESDDTASQPASRTNGSEADGGGTSEEGQQDP